MEGEVGSDRERDAEMDRLLRAVLAEGPAEAAGACPSAEDLAAYVEGALASQEHQAMEAHLAACHRCQDALGLLLSLPAEAAPSAAWPAPSWWRAGWTRWLVPIGAVASAVVLYVAVRPGAGVPPAPTAESVTVSAPAQLPAGPREPAGSPSAPAPPAERGLPSLRKQQVPSRPDAGQAAPLAARKEAAGQEGMTAKPAPSPEAPPALARDTIAPVAALVGTQAPAPQAAPPAPAKVEAREQAAKALPVVGGVPAAQEPTKAAADAESARAAKPLAENVTVTGTASPRQARASIAPPVVVNAAGDAAVRWRLGPGARIEASSDAGRTWRLQYAAPGALLGGSAPDRTTCWAVGAAGLVLLTSDGQSWQVRPFPERTDLIVVTATDALEAIVTDRDGRRFSTKDGGATWTPVG